MSVITPELLTSVMTEVLGRLGARTGPDLSGSALPGRVGDGVAVGSGAVGEESGADAGLAGVALDGGSVGSKESSSLSWSDEVEEALSVGSEQSVVMPQGVAVSDAVKSVKFGGVGDLYPFQEPGVGKSFYSTYVRVERVRALGSFVQSLSGAKLPKAAQRDLALCTYSTGVVPDAFVGGRDRLKGLAVVGDAYLTAHVVSLAVQSGKAVSSAQALRSQSTSDGSLSAAFMRKGMAKFIVTPSGIDLATSKVSATMVEAVIGVVALYREPSVLARFITELGVVSIRL